MSLPIHSKCTNKVLHNTYRKMGIQAACQLAPKHNNPFISWVLPLQAPNCSCPQARACITPSIPLHASPFWKCFFSQFLSITPLIFFQTFSHFLAIFPKPPFLLTSSRILSILLSDFSFIILVDRLFQKPMMPTMSSEIVLPKISCY